MSALTAPSGRRRACGIHDDRVYDLEGKSDHDILVELRTIIATDHEDLKKRVKILEQQQATERANQKGLYALAMLLGGLLGLLSNV